MPCDAVSEWYRVDQIKDLLYKRVSVIVGEESSTAAKNCVSGILIAADPISHRYAFFPRIIVRVDTDIIFVICTCTSA